MWSIVAPLILANLVQDVSDSIFVKFGRAYFVWSGSPGLRLFTPGVSTPNAG